MNNDTRELNTAIAGFESTAANFSVRFIADARVRAEYQLKAKSLSSEILLEIRTGRMSAHEGAAKASQMRNILMDTMRGQSSEIATAYATNIKTLGKSLPELEEIYAKQNFYKSFDQLSDVERNKVWKEIVFSSGRPQKETSNLAKTMGRAGKGFIAITITIAVYNIATAEDKLRAFGKEGAVVGGGMLGSVAGGASAGLACGVGAPVCVAIGVFVGGVLFAVGADYTFDQFWN